MKKHTIFMLSLIIGILFMNLGCTRTQTATGQATNTPPVVTVGQVDVSKLAQAAGIIVAQKYPEFAAQAVPYAKGLLEMAKTGHLTQANFAEAFKLLNDKMGNHAEYLATVALVMSSINVNIQAGAVDNKIVQALQGFIDGMSMFAVTPS